MNEYYDKQEQEIMDLLSGTENKWCNKLLSNVYIYCTLYIFKNLLIYHLYCYIFPDDDDDKLPDSFGTQK